MIEDAPPLAFEGDGAAPSEGERAGAMLARAVRIRGIDVGDPVDVLLDPDLRCALGLEVHCRDGVNRFLPWLSGAFGAEELSVDFPLALLDGPQLDYYRERAVPLNVLRRLTVDDSNGSSARIEDVLVDARGRICALVVAEIDGERAVDPRRVKLDGDRILMNDHDTLAR
jgi:hypothetical protein